MKTHKNIFLRALVISSVMMLTALSSIHAVTMNYQGGWRSTTNYPAGAVVVLNKQTYYALLGSNLNKNPVAFPAYWQPLGTFVPTTYKIGSRGPGGGWIFFVDLYDQYPGFTYLEAAPTDIAPVPWCSNTITSIITASQWDTRWAAKGVGKGRANTTAMLAICASGAAKAADLYVTGTKSDWFLPSLGELKLVHENLLEAGVGGFANVGYWSSTEFYSDSAWVLGFGDGGYSGFDKDLAFRVRAVRAF
jgi:hypothetical protein